MLTSLRSNLFHLLATLFLASVATTQAQAQKASSLTPMAAVINPDTAQRIATVYETPTGGMWIYTDSGPLTVAVVTRFDASGEGSIALHFDEFLVLGEPTDTSRWSKLQSGHIVLTSETLTGGNIGYAMLTHDHSTGTTLPFDDPPFMNIQVEPIVDVVPERPERAAPLKQQHRPAPRQPSVRDNEPILLASYQPSGR